jgi:hypothetical protein
MFNAMLAAGDDASRALQAFADRAAITDLLTTFAVAIDSCDWPRYRSVFTDHIDLDYSSWRAGSIGRWAADDWVVRAAQLFPGFTATRHALTNVLVTLDTDDPDGWRIEGKRLVVQWTTGDASVMDVARARALTDPQGRP